jgi:hypothetical protein
MSGARPLAAIVAEVQAKHSRVRHKRFALRLADIPLPSKAAARDLVRTILHGSPMETPLPDEYTPILLGILDWHPRKDEKLQYGCKGFFVRSNPPFFKENDRGFYVITEHGPPAVSFSYIRCFKGAEAPDTATLNRLIQACRAAIIPSQTGFKLIHFVAGSGQLCPRCNKPLNTGNAQVDHVDPPFRAIVQMFIDRHGLPPDDALHHMATYGWRFVHAADADYFAAFHDGVAITREVICAACNMRTRHQDTVP